MPRTAARADALVRGILAGVMRQQRCVAVAMDYVRALSRETRANCWQLAVKAGHEGPAPASPTFAGFSVFQPARGVDPLSDDGSHHRCRRLHMPES